MMQIFGFGSEKEADIYKMQALNAKPEEIENEIAKFVSQQLNIDRARDDVDDAFVDHLHMVNGMVKRLCDSESPVCTPEMYDDIVEKVINMAQKNASLKDNTIRQLIESGKYSSSSAIQRSYVIGEKYEELKPMVDAMKKGRP
jgi:hypothetical protein